MKYITFLVAVILCSMPVLAQKNKVEKKLVKWVDDHNDEAMSFLEDLVNINSGTMNFEGVKAVADALMPKFEALGMEVEFTDGSSFNRAGHLVARIQGGKGPKILMIGHLDTVFEPNSSFQKWKKVDDETISGPGIADMKGGDVIILQSLSALHAQGLLKDMNIWVVMTGDEELSGSPLSASKAELIEAAKWADIALGFENADGNFKTVNVARRSSSSWKLEVTGKAGHSSQVFKPERGVGAIYEASRILYQFYEELSGEEFLTFNPGAIVGGTETSYDAKTKSGQAFGKNNVIAQSAIVTGDIRCLSMEQLKRTQNKMAEIVAQNLPQTLATITFNEGYPPFPPKDGNYELMKQFSQVSSDLGFGEVTAVNPADAGAADISFTAEFVDRGIDGMGMSGANDHSIDEIGYTWALPMQSKRTAVLLYRLLQD
ncbi:M20/M25/M40 family metallo-hydrolase [Marinoscillum pacificum]|uniref:M20/M25/M40 family metallo-hydrolase n=1 Tax=Marinoscillum pacificum TaxID=392723 RepID=UPI0021579374|nr:M20/M25/M40 family metallo-hydrolase [Marinoscillum pacificum]